MTAAPTTGALSERVQLKRREMTLETEGGHTTLFVPVVTVWARVTGVGARTTQVADGRSVAFTHTVVIRHRGGVRAGDRFTWRGRQLDVVSSEDLSGQRRFLACRCNETRVRG